jgi:hypothetical protein
MLTPRPAIDRPPTMQAFYVTACTNRHRARYHTLAASAIDAALAAVQDHCPAVSQVVRIIVRPVKPGRAPWQRQ